ncbi:YaaC family protein, partial [Micromonospora sp. NPDC126480]|uniref:YaaC family protein n=1 Tax=Micromonospora sp. NPDC126480 TaxID=3155312 RepID=UPI003321A74E
PPPPTKNEDQLMARGVRIQPAQGGQFSTGVDTTVMTRYGDSELLAPAMPSCGRPMHPLMTWWGVLYILSMLARYQPAAWTEHIDVNSSRYAVALESLLNDALVAVPRIIHQTIDEVAQH